MKRIIFLFAFILLLASARSVYAQGMMGGNQNITASEASSTAADEAKGKEVFDKLQSKQTDCKSLTNDDFDVLGDYYMGNMLVPSGAEGMGSSHAFMNAMMTQRLGDEGEKQMHIAMGKRLSGCDPNAAFPQGAGAMMSMMGYGGMMGNWNNQSWAGAGFPMMGSFYGNMMGWGGNSGVWSVFGLLTWVLVVVFLILGIVYFWKGINKK